MNRYYLEYLEEVENDQKILENIQAEELEELEYIQNKVFEGVFTSEKAIDFNGAKLAENKLKDTLEEVGLTLDSLF